MSLIIVLLVAIFIFIYRYKKNKPQIDAFIAKEKEQKGCYTFTISF